MDNSNKPKPIFGCFLRNTKEQHGRTLEHYNITVGCSRKNHQVCCFSVTPRPLALAFDLEMRAPDAGGASLGTLWAQQSWLMLFVFSWQFRDIPFCHRFFLPSSPNVGRPNSFSDMKAQLSSHTYWLATVGHTVAEMKTHLESAQVADLFVLDRLRVLVCLGACLPSGGNLSGWEKLMVWRLAERPPPLWDYFLIFCAAVQDRRILARRSTRTFGW